MSSGVVLNERAVWWAPGIEVDRLFGAARRRVPPGSPIDQELMRGQSVGPLLLYLTTPVRLANEIRSLLLDTAWAEITAIDRMAEPVIDDVVYRDRLGGLVRLLGSPEPIVPVSRTPAGGRLATPVTADFVARLVPVGPDLDELFQGHLTTFGGLYPNVLLGEVSFLVQRLLRSPAPQDRTNAVVAIRFLEREYGSSTELDAVIGGFLAQLPPRSANGSRPAIVDQLGPKLRVALERQRRTRRT